MKALVIGYGSIGARHVRILLELGCRVGVVSARETSFEPRFSSIDEAVSKFDPGYVVIASETARHVQDISALTDSGYRGMLLVEKPLFHTVSDIPSNFFQSGFVAYNLRFHPLLQRLRELLKQEKIISVQAYAGQYLPLWRPDRDYQAGYSADRNAGGGVIRDLSHELDYLNWILGGWQKMTALGGRFSALEITSDDVFSVMMTTARCPVVTLELNYLDRVGRRRIIVNTDKKTIEADFITGRLMIDGVAEEYQVERDHTYSSMHRALLDGNSQEACTFAEGLEVVRLIEAAEQAVVEERWISR